MRTALPLLALLAVANTAAAAPLIDGTDPQKVLELAKGFGSAELETDAAGDPSITGRMEGIKYGIFFYGCTDGRNCSELQLSTGWTDAEIGLDRLNAWNRDHRYGKAYLDDENDPCLEMTVNLKHGVSRQNLEDTLDWWKVAMTTFKKDVVEN